MRYRFYLGSGSPRRVELLRQMNIPFKQRVVKVDEVYSQELEGASNSNNLSWKKEAACF